MVYLLNEHTSHFYFGGKSKKLLRKGNAFQKML
jgi:hypothetical protein